jgi:putative heme iron utilization protein
MKKLTNEEIIEKFDTFTQDKYSLTLSTTSINNIPHTNYSPFVENDNYYFICVSEALPHFINMNETKKAHVFIIEDEEKASHIYARKRLYFNSTCEVVKDSESIFKLFDKRYGDKLSFLRTMHDFKIIKLIPEDKSLVLGFGAAYKMDKNGNLVNKNIEHK